MRRLLPLVVVVLACANAPRLENRLREGDVIFHESRSAQSRAIQLATGSRYSHMGIVSRQDGKWFVYEAVQPVTMTPLREWIARGRDGHYVVKRLRRPLAAAELARMQNEGKRHRGKSYDLVFGWDDDRIYCSELVWKIYKRGAGVEIGKLARLRDFDLSAPAVKAKMRERYGNRIPMDEPVISPAAMFDSKELVEVARD